MERSAAIPACVFLLLGCSQPSAPRSATVAAAPTAEAARLSPAAAAVDAVAAERSGCPPFNRRSRVISRPISEGAELLFWTPDDTSALRQRVSMLSLPQEVVGASRVRTDNIHEGIRYVFAPNQASDVIPVRLAVHDYARAISRKCGLRLAPPKTERKDRPVESLRASSKAGPSKPPARAETKSPAASTTKPKKSSSASPSKPATAKPATPAASTRPASPISDPFKPPLPPAPKPPPNPFR